MSGAWKQKQNKKQTKQKRKKKKALKEEREKKVEVCRQRRSAQPDHEQGLALTDNHSRGGERRDESAQ